MQVGITYFSDLLCIWAYVAQIRLDELHRNFGEQLSIELRSVPVFGSTAGKIGNGWKDRDGYEGYARHVREIAERFPHVELHREIWTREIPAGSLSAHQFLSAAALACAETACDDGRPLLEELSWRLRLAFFRDLRDIARLEVQFDVAREMNLPIDEIRGRLEDGRALATLAEDHELATRHHVTGSPTFLINEGRQTLYGNVGYRIIEANIEELLIDGAEKASWC